MYFEIEPRELHLKKNISFNLPALGMERRQLHKAQKIDNFCWGKSVFDNQMAIKRTDLELIRLMRVESAKQDKQCHSIFEFQFFSLFSNNVMNE